MLPNEGPAVPEAVVDPDSLKVKAMYPAGRGVRDIELIPNRDLILAVNYLDKSMDVIRMSDGTPLGRFRVGYLPRGVAASSDGSLTAVFTGCGTLAAKTDDLVSKANIERSGKQDHK